RFLNDETPSIEEVRRLARAYGILDGRTSTRYAEAFAAVNFALTDERRAELVRIRNLRGFATEGVFLYSRAIPMPEILGTESLFR
ncbi:MAG: hypothetical protein H6834_08530, partial [Planctomycetes bacterium]|nr:hypothetical protein [Planctomycetota bacterium]